MQTASRYIRYIDKLTIPGCPLSVSYNFGLAVRRTALKENRIAKVGTTIRAAAKGRGGTDNDESANPNPPKRGVHPLRDRTRRVKQ